MFGGSSCRAFTDEVCAHLGLARGGVAVSRFSNDCIQVQLQESCRERDVYVVQTLATPVQEHLVEMLLMIDAARGAGASRITAVVPHFAYARSDKKDAPRISLGARLAADLLATAGADRVLTMDLHSPQVHGFFSVPVDHLTALGVMAEHFADTDLSRTVVVSPDLGGAKPADALARMLGVPVAAGSKKRIADDAVVIDSIVGDVEGRDVIVLDDEIATGGSVVELLDVLGRHGVGTVSLACTHGLFTGPAVERLSGRDDLAAVVTTDTVPQEGHGGLPGFTVLSVAPLFAETIRRTHAGESVSALFPAEAPIR